MNKIELLKSVFGVLEENNVNYCVLRNYDFLLEEREPIKDSEKSIDLVVSKKDFSAFNQVMKQFGFTKRDLSFSHTHHPYFKIKNLEKISFDVQVGGIHWNDMPYLGEEIFDNNVKKAFFYTLSDNDMFVMLLAHSILGKRRFKPEYQEILLNLKVDRDYVVGKFTSIFNKEIALKMINLNFKEILQMKYRLILSFIFKSSKNVSTFIKLFFRWVKWKKSFTSYPLISMIGPDGSGKTTMAKSLSSFLKQNNKKASLIYTGRGREQIIPFRKLFKKYKSKERKKDRVSKPKKSDLQFRKVLYTLAAPLFTLDLLLRYLIRMFPKRRKGYIVITDRYCSDILLMEHVPLWLRKFFLSLFPKPTLTFYFHNDVEVLHRRRPEEPVDGLKRQLNIFEELRPILKPIDIISYDKEKNKEEVFTKVWEYLLQGWW